MHLPDVDLRIAWYATEWLIRLGALFVVPLRRSPTATASWLLLIFFFPSGGLLIYLLIGRPAFPAARERRWRALQPFLADVAQRLAISEMQEEREVERFARTLGRMPAVDGNSLELIDNY